jgi:hypothetical protein
MMGLVRARREGRLRGVPTILITFACLTLVLSGCGRIASDAPPEPEDTGGTGGSPSASGTGGSGAEPWRTETDPIELCSAWDDAFCSQFIECFGEDFSENLCTADPSTHAQCDRANAVSSDYVECMEVLTTPPCIGSLPAICDGVIVYE